MTAPTAAPLPERPATIKQRHAKDCMLCCLAMAAGLTYNAACAKWGAAFVAEVAEKGCYGKVVDQAFAALGLVKDSDYVVRYFNVGDANTGFMRNVLWGRRALLQVRSKNYAGETHIVYWDGDALHDPSNLLTYDWNEVEPTHVWLFREAAAALAQRDYKEAWQRCVNGKAANEALLLEQAKLLVSCETEVAQLRAALAEKAAK